jgi:hypothetical protein
MSIPDESTGNLVALEGDVGSITTQLRLLPPSSKILTFPPLSSILSKSSSDGRFDAKKYVLQAHETFTQRCDQARSFLRSSTGAQPRLVFMNGGCVSARTACITRISEELAAGDIVEGERIFNRIVERGVAGLVEEDSEMKSETIHNEAEATPRPTEVEELDQEIPVREPVEAKVLLYTPEQTSSRVEPSEDAEMFYKALTNAHDSRRENLKSTSVPNIVAAFRKQLPRGAEYDVPPVETLPTDAKSDGTRHSFEKRTSFGSYTSNQADDDVEETDFEEAEEHHENEEVVYGEACVVEVNKPTNGPQRMIPQEMMGPFSTSPYASPYGTLRRIRSHELTRPRLTLPAKRGSSLDNLPRTVYVRRPSNPKVPKPVYVDQGCDPVVEQQPVVEAPFQPIFPLVEDLVIHFSDGNIYEVFDYVIKSYKNGSYPQSPVKTEEQKSVPNSPIATDPRPVSTVTIETDDEGQHRRHELNLYSPSLSQHSPHQGRFPRKVSKRIPNMLSIQSPPTPAATPPLTRYSSTRFERFIEFSPVNIKTALGIQNSFRSLLSQRFPSALGYKQLSYPSETDRFWKPVLRNDEGYQNDGRTVDQILAVGYAERVNRELFHTVSGQIEGLGVKRSGLRKSATIDLR